MSESQNPLVRLSDDVLRRAASGNYLTPAQQKDLKEAAQIAADYGGGPMHSTDAAKRDRARYLVEANPTALVALVGLPTKLTGLRTVGKARVAEELVGHLGAEEATNLLEGLLEQGTLTGILEALDDLPSTYAEVCDPKILASAIARSMDAFQDATGSMASRIARRWCYKIQDRDDYAVASGDATTSLLDRMIGAHTLREWAVAGVWYGTGQQGQRAVLEDDSPFENEITVDEFVILGIDPDEAYQILRELQGNDQLAALSLEDIADNAEELEERHKKAESEPSLSAQATQAAQAAADDLDFGSL